MYIYIHIYTHQMRIAGRSQSSRTLGFGQAGKFKQDRRFHRKDEPCRILAAPHVSSPSLQQPCKPIVAPHLNPETLAQNPEPALKLELFHPSPVPQQNSEDSVGFLDSGRVSGSTGRQPLLSQDATSEFPSLVREATTGCSIL